MDDEATARLAALAEAFLRWTDAIIETLERDERERAMLERWWVGS